MKINTVLFFILIIIIIFFDTKLNGQVPLPKVFGDDSIDIIGSSLELEAARAYISQQVPGNKEAWIKHREELKAKLIEKTGAAFFPDLPLDYHETKSNKLPGLTVKNIFFQTRPGIYATANLYIPDGAGPFPGVVTMMGHSANGRLYDQYQAIGYALALDGYVSVHIDPWGAGERTTTHGEFEYHGANLGGSLMNIGETLMGLQITDNMRAVDLLCSLPFVNSEKIGATGASGGGNQTMWLAALDERVKAAVPVVSVGTFQSYVMGSNCICETLVDGLTFTEEASVLGLIAPRALKICNGLKDTNKAFSPSEMLRSFERTKPIYGYYEAEENISHQIFDTPHGYFPEIREAMLGWFDLHLKNKGSGAPKKEKTITYLQESDLMTFTNGKRYSGVVSTVQYCSTQGTFLRNKVLLDKKINTQNKTEELKKLLRIPADSRMQKIHDLSKSESWSRLIIETNDGQLIPVLIYLANMKSPEYVLIVNREGKNKISGELINEYVKNGKGVCIVDLWGTGENISTSAERIDGNRLGRDFHTLSRSAFWLGKTTQGIWINQLNIVSEWLLQTHKVRNFTIDATKEAAVAALLFSSLEKKADALILRNAPLSYLFDSSGNINYFSMAIHMPGFLKWGDISLAAGISGNEINFVTPVSISGRKLIGEDLLKYQEEFNALNEICGNHSNIIFTEK